DPRLVRRELLADPAVAGDEVERELADVACLDLADATRNEVIVEELHGRPSCQRSRRLAPGKLPRELARPAPVAPRMHLNPGTSVGFRELDRPQPVGEPQMEMAASRMAGQLPLARDGETATLAVRKSMVEPIRQLEPDQARAGSNLSFAASAGTSVGYSPVRQARH